MDVSADVLEELKCGECGMYLSRGPVYLQHDGAAVCGRCLSPKRPATRNKQYEAVAKLLRFPCKNVELGCGETVAFEEIVHEARCPYRQYACPMLGSSYCSWLGPRNQLLQHCRAEHPDHVLNNPCSIAHDITTSTLHNYVLQAYQLLFVLLTKVCLTSGRIYHSVRLLHAEEMAQDFTYTLNIKRNNAEITSRGDVGPGDCLELQEPTAQGLDINSLLSVLGGWGGASCTVAVERRRWRGTCAGCAADITMKLYQDEGGWQCERCAPTRRSCKNRSCTHQDIPGKCSKHEAFFCLQRTNCYICCAGVSRNMLSTHYISAHSDVMCNSGFTWRATRGLWQRIVTCPAGNAVCKYWLTGSQFVLRVFIPVLSEWLCEFRCEVRVTQPTTGLTHTYTPDVTYNNEWDWSIEVVDLFPYDLDISVNITEIEFLK